MAKLRAYSEGVGHGGQREKAPRKPHVYGNAVSWYYGGTQARVLARQGIAHVNSTFREHSLISQGAMKSPKTK